MLRSTHRSSALAGELCGVFKLRIGVAIAAAALAGMAVSSGPPVPFWKAAVLALAVLAASGAAGAFNQIADRDIDARMARTRSRPFASGAWRASERWLYGIALALALAVGCAAIGVGLMAALYILLGAVVYGIIYTLWLKRRTPLNIVVGGLAGSFAVLAGAAAVDPVPDPPSAVLAVTLFLWTPPHFWSLAIARRDDYIAARVPMLPVIVGPRAAALAVFAHVLALVALSLWLGTMGLGRLYLAAAIAGGASFIWYSGRLLRRPSPEAALASFHASLIQLALLLGGAMADRWLGG